MGINKPNNISLPLNTPRDKPPLAEVNNSYYSGHKYSLYIKSLKGYTNK